MAPPWAVLGNPRGVKLAASIVLQVAMAITDTKTVRGVLDCIGNKEYLNNMAKLMIQTLASLGGAMLLVESRPVFDG
jgi:hypothetical protein